MTLALEISGLSKTYGNGFTALKGINLKVEQGDFFALLGPNGAGKSTTLGIVSSLVTPTQGKVLVNGFNLQTQRNEVKRSLGVVPQEFNFNFFEKVYDIVKQQAGYYGLTSKLAASRTEYYLKKLDLWDKRFDTARALSGGMKRRLMIARALIHEPQILILDEPTAGVDIELRRSMWEFLQEINAQGTTIILTTHYLEEAESLCRNIAIINGGEIVANTSAKELLSQLTKATFVVDVKGEPSHSGGPFNFRVVDEHSLEFDVENGQILNDAFLELEKAGQNVISIRPKNNRLEEVFVDLVQDKGDSND